MKKKINSFLMKSLLQNALWQRNQRRTN